MGIKLRLNLKNEGPFGASKHQRSDTEPAEDVKVKVKVDDGVNLRKRLERIGVLEEGRRDQHALDTDIQAGESINNRLNKRLKTDNAPSLNIHPPRQASANQISPMLARLGNMTVGDVRIMLARADPDMKFLDAVEAYMNR